MTTSIDSPTASEETPARGEQLRAEVHDAARRARTAADSLALATTDTKNAVLHAVAEALVRRTPEILEANARDVDDGRVAGLSDGLIDRLALTADRVAGVADGLRTVAGLADPVGEVVRGNVLPNGLQLQQVRVPFGVVGIVYEGRPNVTVDAAGLTLKSGNAVLLRGSSSAAHSNAVLVTILRDVLVEHGLPADCVRLLPAHDRESVQHLITARGLVDVVIPRGGAGLISAVVDNATVPAIETGAGNCHVFVDADAELDKAVDIVVNSKARRVSVCNAAETLLVHRDVAERFLPTVLRELGRAGVRVHGDEHTRSLAPAEGCEVVAATAEDWATEYGSPDLAVAVVDSRSRAIEHIAEHGDRHTEAIVTTDIGAAREFTARVDAAAVMVNASTAFTDGGQFGMGAEIGISTQKMHARGPMGLPELTSTKWTVFGDGHVRPA